MAIIIIHFRSSGPTHVNKYMEVAYNYYIKHFKYSGIFLEMETPSSHTFCTKLRSPQPVCATQCASYEHLCWLGLGQVASSSSSYSAPIVPLCDISLLPTSSPIKPVHGCIIWCLAVFQKPLPLCWLTPAHQPSLWDLANVWSTNIDHFHWAAIAGQRQLKPKRLTLGRWKGL